MPPVSVIGITEDDIKQRNVQVALDDAFWVGSQAVHDI